MLRCFGTTCFRVWTILASLGHGRQRQKLETEFGRKYVADTLIELFLSNPEERVPIIAQNCPAPRGQYQPAEGQKAFIAKLADPLE